MDTNINVPDEIESTNIIGRISSANYGAFTKILSIISTNMGKTDTITIEEGKLGSISGGGFLHCDLSILFGENNFIIIDPQYSIKLLKLITGGDEVVFIDDEDNSRYLISNLVDDNPQISIVLPKPDPEFGTKISYPELGEEQEHLDLDPDLVNTFSTAEKNIDSQYFILEIFKDPESQKYKILSIATDKETFKYNFKKEDNQDDTKKFKLFNPFPVPKPDSIEFQLFADQNNEEVFWVKTTSEIGMAKIEYMEKLTPMGIFDSFSL